MNTVIVAVASYAIGVVALICLVEWVRLKGNGRLGLAVGAVVALLVVAVGVKAAGASWTDVRPFVVDHSTPLIAHSVDNGFPSDHTALAAAMAATLAWWRRPTGLALMLIALAIGAARVAAGVHHWPDILAGLAVGVVAGLVGGGVGRWVQGRWHSPLTARA